MINSSSSNFLSSISLLFDGEITGFTEVFSGFDWIIDFFFGKTFTFSGTFFGWIKSFFLGNTRTGVLNGFDFIIVFFSGNALTGEGDISFFEVFDLFLGPFRGDNDKAIHLAIGQKPH